MNHSALYRQSPTQHAFVRMLVLSIAALSLGGFAGQDYQRLPARVQAVMFKKRLAYTKSVTPGARLAVVFDENTASDKDEIISECATLSMDAVEVRSEKFSQLTGIQVAYLLSSSAAIRKMCRMNNILTLSGNALNVTRGDAAVGVVAELGKPKIIVNMDELKAVGHTMSSDVLKLAIIVYSN